MQFTGQKAEQGSRQPVQRVYWPENVIDWLGKWRPTCVMRHARGPCICTIYNMSGRVVSDIQTRAEGESLYIRYNTDANVVNDLKNDSSYEFIGEVILKINVV